MTGLIAVGYEKRGTNENISTIELSHWLLRLWQMQKGIQFSLLTYHKQKALLVIKFYFKINLSFPPKRAPGDSFKQIRPVPTSPNWGFALVHPQSILAIARCLHAYYEIPILGFTPFSSHNQDGPELHHVSAECRSDNSVTSS